LHIFKGLKYFLGVPVENIQYGQSRQTFDEIHMDTDVKAEKLVNEAQLI